MGFVIRRYYQAETLHGLRYQAFLGYAKAGIDQFRIRPKYKPESPESLIGGELDIVATKSAEILQGVRHQAALGCAKAGIDQFRFRPEYEPESPESLINDDLIIVTTKSAESLHMGSLLECLRICKSYRSIPYQIRIPAGIAEPVISGDLGIAATKSAESLHRGSLLD